MRKKDFEAIAQAIKDARDALLADVVQRGKPETSVKEATIVGRTFDSMARDVSKVLATTNPKFDRARFLIGCGVK